MAEKLILLKKSDRTDLKSGGENHVDVGTGSAVREVVDWLLGDIYDDEKIAAATGAARELIGLKGQIKNSELGLMALLLDKYLGADRSKELGLDVIVVSSASATMVKNRVVEVKKEMSDYFDNKISKASSYWQKQVFGRDLDDIVFWTMCEL